MEKEKRITIRLSEKEYNILKEDAHKDGITISNYIRNKLFCYDNVLQNMYYMGQVDLQNIKKELIMMESYIEGLPQSKGDIKEYIKERIEKYGLC